MSNTEYLKGRFLPIHKELLELLWNMAEDLAILDTHYKRAPYEHSVHNTIKATDAISRLKKELNAIYREYSPEAKRANKKPLNRRP